MKNTFRISLKVGKVELNPEDDEADDPAEEDFRREVLDVPAKTDMFHLHQGDAADAAHGEQTTADGCGVGDDAPKDAVDGNVAHADLIEGDVADGDGEGIYQAAEQACANAHEPDVVDVGVEPIGDVCPDASLSNDAHAEHDAHDEEHLL